MSAIAPGASPLPVGPGSRLGPYEVMARLGAGGMGEVFRALDPRLGRAVAIKLLPPEMAAHPTRVRRFEQEARASSALNHPHIVTVHDVGTVDSRLYIVMELVEGRTLRDVLAGGPLPVRRALELTLQIASGLAKAHAAGIVHRDLKPENVMVTADGFVKVLDFGLAKLAASDEGTTAAARTESITGADAVLGTVGYMSPEQARGDVVDFRSDQFTLGGVLYELLTARRAFSRPTPVATLGAILHDEPEPLARAAPGVPAELAWIVERCLAKDPGHRYAATGDLVRDLERVRDQTIRTASGTPASASRVVRTGGRLALLAAVVILAVVAGRELWRGQPPARGRAAAPNVSLAVLPLRNLAGAAGDEYLVDGLTEAVITGLSQVRGLAVISANSTFRYKGQPVDVRKAGQELGVTHLLEGSVQREGDRLRVSAQLVDVASGRQLWAEKYDRHAGDVFALQDGIAREIADALRLRAARGAPATSNMDAYDAYLRGTYRLRAFFPFEAADRDEAITLFERAVALDPEFALAHAALAQAYTTKAFYDDPDVRWEEKAFVHVERALRADPGLAEGYLARGQLTWTRSHRFPHEAAMQDFRRALDINPNLVGARWAAARIYQHLGLFDRALAELEIARRLDPKDLSLLDRRAKVLAMQRQYQAALEDFEAAGTRTTEGAVALWALGRTAEARALAEELLRGEPSDPEVVAHHALILARTGQGRRARAEIARAVTMDRGHSHFHHAQYFIGATYSVLGDEDEAVRFLQAAAAEGFPCYPFFATDPDLAPLAADTRFQAFMSRLKTQWERYQSTL